MGFSKTAAGRLALADRGNQLSMRERHLLILCDGRRTEESLRALMGDDVPGLLKTMAQHGFVERGGSAQAAAPAVARRVQSPAPVPVPATGPTPAPVGPRRSLAGAKMYVIDLLQMQRDLDASALATAVHLAASEAELVNRMATAVQLIRERSGDTYADRVLRHLHQSVPEQHLPALTQTLALEVARPSASS